MSRTFSKNPPNVLENLRKILKESPKHSLATFQTFLPGDVGTTAERPERRTSLPTFSPSPSLLSLTVRCQMSGS